jgi:glycerol-3-phosphate dehydrogenase
MFRKTERDAKRRNTVSDEIRDEETEGTEDVEGHGLVNAPGAASPSINRDDDDSDDVEAHGLINQPNINQPNIN